jgi:hypothetical protein
VRYRALIIGTDLAAATRPLKSRASGNKHLAAAGSTLLSVTVFIRRNFGFPRHGWTPAGPRPSDVSGQHRCQARFTTAGPCDQVRSRFDRRSQGDAQRFANQTKPIERHQSQRMNRLRKHPSTISIKSRQSRRGDWR